MNAKGTTSTTIRLTAEDQQALAIVRKALGPIPFAAIHRMGINALLEKHSLQLPLTKMRKSHKAS